MKKFLSLITVACLSMISAMAAVVTPVTDLEQAVIDGTVLTIGIGDKYLYGPNAQNCAMGDANTAVSSSNGCVGYKVEKDGDNYMFRCVTPAGGDYMIWGRTEPNYLNAQPNIGGVTFNLNNGSQKGTDMANGAVWTLEEGKYLKNVGNGGYFAGTVTSAEPVEVQFVTIVGDPEPEPDPIVVPEVLQKLIDAKTVFYMKTGDTFLYNPDNQNIKAGTYEEASAASNHTNCYVLEATDYCYMLRCVKLDGSDVNIYGKNPCYLNCTGVMNGVIFNLGKDQDAKNGSSWLIEEVDGGYKLKNMASGGYLSTNNTNAEGLVWEFFVPGEETGWDGTVTTSLDDVTLKNWHDLEGIKIKFNGAKSVATIDETFVSVEDTWSYGSSVYVVWSPTYGGEYTVNGDEITLTNFVDAMTLMAKDRKVANMVKKAKAARRLAAEGDTDYQLNMYAYGFVIDGNINEDDADFDIYFNCEAPKADAEPFMLTAISNNSVNGSIAGVEASEQGVANKFIVTATGKVLAKGEGIPSLMLMEDADADFGEATVSVSEEGEASISFLNAGKDFFTAPGTYVLMIPEGTFVDEEGAPNTTIAAKWVVIQKEPEAGWDGTVTTSLDDVTLKNWHDLEGIKIKFNGAKSVATIDETFVSVEDTWSYGSSVYVVWSPTYGGEYTVNGDEITLTNFVDAMTLMAKDRKVANMVKKAKAARRLAAEGDTDYQLNMYAYGFVIDGNINEDDADFDIYFNCEAPKADAEPFMLTAISNNSVNGSIAGVEASEQGVANKFIVTATGKVLAKGEGVPTLVLMEDADADFGEATVSVSEEGEASINFLASGKDFFTAPGTYVLMIPEGTFVDEEGNPNEAVAAKWVVIEKEPETTWDGTVINSIGDKAITSLSDLDNMTLTFPDAGSIAILGEEDCQFLALENEDGSELYGVWAPTMGSEYTIEGNTITIGGFVPMEGFTVAIPAGTTKLYIEDYGTFVIDGEEVYLDNIELNAAFAAAPQPFMLTSVVNNSVAGSVIGVEASEQGVANKFIVAATGKVLAKGEGVPTLMLMENADANFGEATVAVSEEGEASISFLASGKDFFTAPGTYVLMIPEGTFVDEEGNPNEAVAAKWVVIEKEPEVVLEEGLIEIAQTIDADQNMACKKEVNENIHTTKYTSGDGVTVQFKMLNVDVENCDYIVIKFSEPVATGAFRIAFWAHDNKCVEIPAGVTEYKYVFAEDDDLRITDGKLAEITMISWFSAGQEINVYGVYKHKIDEAVGIDSIKSEVKDGKFIKNGQMVIVKDGKMYNTVGVRIK